MPTWCTLTWGGCLGGWPGRVGIAWQSRAETHMLARNAYREKGRRTMQQSHFVPSRRALISAVGGTPRAPTPTTRAPQRELEQNQANKRAGRVRVPWMCSPMMPVIQCAISEARAAVCSSKHRGYHVRMLTNPGGHKTLPFRAHGLSGTEWKVGEGGQVGSTSSCPNSIRLKVTLWSSPWDPCCQHTRGATSRGTRTKALLRVTACRNTTSPPWLRGTTSTPWLNGSGSAQAPSSASDMIWTQQNKCSPVQS